MPNSQAGDEGSIPFTRSPVQRLLDRVRLAFGFAHVLSSSAANWWCLSTSRGPTAAPAHQAGRKDFVAPPREDSLSLRIALQQPRHVGFDDGHTTNETGLP